MATKKQLAEQVLRKLSGGNVVSDTQIDIRELMLDLDQLRDEYVKNMYYLNAKSNIYSIDQEFLTEEDVALTFNSFIDELTLNKATFSLSSVPISLPRGTGIQAVYEDSSQKPYVIVDSAQMGFFANKLSRNVGSNIYVKFKGNSGELITSATTWFLPSIDELEQMHLNLFLNGIGGFDGLTRYWSSSQDDVNPLFAKSLTMYSGNVSSPAKSATGLVRPCRSFKAGKYAFNIGEPGISGGYIFYYDSINNRYYEAAPSDLPSQIWSDVSTEITDWQYGGQYVSMSDEIGSGVVNTYGIMTQAAHTASAALSAYDSNKTAKVLYAKTSADIGESEDYPLSPDAQSEILDNLFEKYIPTKQIPHDETVDGIK